MTNDIRAIKVTDTEGETTIIPLSRIMIAVEKKRRQDEKVPQYELHIRGGRGDFWLSLSREEYERVEREVFDLS